MMQHPNHSFNRRILRRDTSAHLLEPVLAGVILAAIPQAASAQEGAEKENLETVVVTATLQDSFMAECPSSISVLDETTIEELGALSVNQLLEEIPGLHEDVESGRSSRPSIRGTNGEQTLVLIDGRRQAPGFKRKIDLSQILVGGIERIEVVRGPVSSLYGSEAIGGVVNIITKKAPKKEAEGLLSTYYGGGEYNEYSASSSGGAFAGIASLFYCLRCMLLLRSLCSATV